MDEYRVWIRNSNGHWEMVYFGLFDLFSGWLAKGFNLNAIDPDLIMQSSGLYDDHQDDIFEDDIVQMEYKGVSSVGKVKFSSGAFYLLTGEKACLHMVNKVCDLKILGNVHQSPELLGGV